METKIRPFVFQSVDAKNKLVDVLMLDGVLSQLTQNGRLGGAIRSIVNHSPGLSDTNWLRVKDVLLNFHRSISAIKTDLETNPTGDKKLFKLVCIVENTIKHYADHPLPEPAVSCFIAMMAQSESIINFMRCPVNHPIYQSLIDNIGEHTEYVITHAGEKIEFHEESTPDEDLDNLSEEDPVDESRD